MPPTGNRRDARRDGLASEEAIWAQLRNVYESEIPVNIVDLGLVYGLRVEPIEGGRQPRSHVVMTLTAPGCGMADVMVAADAKSRVERVPGREGDPGRRSSSTRPGTT